MTSIGNRADALISRLETAAAEMATDQAKEYTAYGWTKPSMGAENYGGLMPQIIIGLADDTGCPIAMMGDSLFIYDDTSGIYEQFDIEHIDNLKRIVAINLGFNVEQFYGTKFDNTFSKELSRRAAMSRMLKRGEKAARGVQFLDGFVSINKRGKVTFTRGFCPTRMCTFRAEIKFEGTELKEVPQWMDLLRYQKFSTAEIEYIHAMIGNSIMGDPTEAQRCLMFVGLGGTGKSTIIDLIGAAVGEHNRHDVDSLDQLTGNNGRHVAAMAHSVITIASDSSADFRNKEMLKKIISKEPIAVEMKYKNPEPVTPRSSLILASNDSGIAYQMGDSGIGRRFDIIKFNVEVRREDKNSNIRQEIQANLPMLILTWLRALEEYIPKAIQTHEHRSDGFHRPKWMEQAMREEAVDNDPTLTALAMVGLSTSEPLNSTEHSVIYLHAPAIQEALKTQLENAGEDQRACSSRRVGTRLTNLGTPLVGRKTNGSKWRRFYIIDETLYGKQRFDTRAVSTTLPA